MQRNHSSNKWPSLGVMHTVKHDEAEMIGRPFCRRHFSGIFLKDTCHTLIINFTEIWTWGYIRQQSSTGTVEQWNKVTTVTLFPAWPLPDQTEQVRSIPVDKIKSLVLAVWNVFTLFSESWCSRGVHRVACQCSQGCLSVFTGLLVSVHGVACQCSQGWSITNLLWNMIS